jgi:hypothetical protein
MNLICRSALLLLAVSFCIVSKAQVNRLQYPLLLKKAYFGVDVGSLNYPFSNKDLPANYTAEAIQVPHTALRLTLFGYHFTKNLSARITYMRPVQWVLFKNLNGDHLKHSVWMNVGEITAKGNMPLGKKLSLFGEAGFALITRNGFDIDNTPVISDASYSTISLGGGMEFHVNSKWDLNIYSSYSPGKSQIKQPNTVFIGGGFSYNMNSLSADKINIDKEDSKRSFPKQMMQFAYTTNKLGYGANHFFGEGKIPVFWGGSAEVEHGFAVNYTRNVFHTRKTFSLDVGASVGSWESKANDQSFYSISVNPVMRFTVLRCKPGDFYFFYSVAGPSYISQTELDGHDTGKHFTFRDFMGIGSYIGHRELLNMEINIGHFSNGNLFPNNAAVKIPLSFALGYAF